jgi:hypothetical protein
MTDSMEYAGPLSLSKLRDNPDSIRQEHQHPQIGRFTSRLLGADDVDRLAFFSAGFPNAPRAYSRPIASRGRMPGDYVLVVVRTPRYG